MANEFLKNVTELFRTTDDKFTKLMLCHIGINDLDATEVPQFCGVGECIHAVGFTCKQLEHNANIGDFSDYDDSSIGVVMQTKLIERFKVDFTQRYAVLNIECIFCIQNDEEPTPLRKFEDVVNHINDCHTDVYSNSNTAFKMIADKLEEIAKYYDLQTGEYIYEDKK